MNPESLMLNDLQEVLEQLRAEVARLSERVAVLERTSCVPTAPSQANPATAVVNPTVADVSEELVVVLSAAIAAYLGVKPRIRQVRLLGSTSWALTGRATIQASHAFSIPHG